MPVTLNDSFCIEILSIKQKIFLQYNIPVKNCFRLQEYAKTFGMVGSFEMIYVYFAHYGSNTRMLMKLCILVWRIIKKNHA
ncbi:hypothetical protein GCM10008919_16130 [Selenomonas dianae]|uniref:Uncharacterized protein n=1 Tax=Selenomonas dianae TaxID=135079 RepID=A0ABN0T6E2_9FIRM